jgi:hypothetical protein
MLSFESILPHRWRVYSPPPGASRSRPENTGHSVERERFRARLASAQALVIGGYYTIGNANNVDDGEKAMRFAGCDAYRGLVPAERIAGLGLERGSPATSILRYGRSS